MSYRAVAAGGLLLLLMAGAAAATDPVRQETARETDGAPEVPSHLPGATLAYSTALGGGGRDQSYAVAVDSSGHAYVAGTTQSSDFPTTPGAYDTTINSGQDAFITKLKPDGSSPAWSTFLGGNDEDHIFAIALDPQGNVLVTGETASTNFPVSPGAYDATYNGGYTDTFAAKISADGSTLMFSTYLGGSDMDDGEGIAADPAGNVYVGGITWSPDFPTSLNAFDRTLGGSFDPWVAKFDPNGTQLTYSTYVGGSGSDSGFGLALAPGGVAVLSGWTGSADFPTVPGSFDTSFNGVDDCFVAAVNPAGTALAYSTFVGGALSDICYDLETDSGGAAFASGATTSADFPATPGAYDTTHNGGGDDAFVFRLRSGGSALEYATYFGGPNTEYAWGVAVDPAGNAYITGNANSTGLPTTPGGFDPTFNGGADDIFMARIDPTGASLGYSTYLGGSDDENAYLYGPRVGAGEVGRAVVTGPTRSRDFPATPGAFNTTFDGYSAFVSSFDTLGSAAPAVLASDPTDGGADVPLSTRIRLWFNQPMDNASLQNALSVSPALLGASFIVAGSELSVSHAGLDPSTNYTVTLSTSAKSVGGVPLPAAYSFTFRTIASPPQVESTWPGWGDRDVPLDSEVLVNFSQRMDPSSTAAAFSIDPPVPGGSASVTDSRLTWSHATPFAPYLAYTVTISTAAKNLQGDPLPFEYTFRFTTLPLPPKVVGTSPANGSKEVDPGTSVVIRFSEEMDEASVRNGTTMFPAVASMNVSLNGWNATIKPGAPLKNDTIYYVTVHKGVRSANGASLPEPYIFSFRTKPDDPKPPPDGTPPGKENAPDMMLVLVLVALIAAGAASAGAFVLVRRRRRDAPPTGPPGGMRPPPPGAR